MRIKQSHNQIHASIAIAVSIACGLLIACVAFKPASLWSAMVVVLFVTLVISQCVLLRVLSTQKARLARYRRMGRRMVQLNTEKRRDEKAALRILNHIVSGTTQPNTHNAAWQRPLRGFSGDLTLDCDSEVEGKRYTLLADLTGHGITAAMGISPVASIFKATARRGLPVEDVITELNNRLDTLLPSGFFCCAAVIMTHEGHATVCNAGLPDILITNESGEVVQRVPSEQLPLGIQPVQASEVQVFNQQFDSPHQLYAFTDGLTETSGANDEVFDIDEQISQISITDKHCGRLNKITDSFIHFTKDSTFNDDISIVEVIIQ